MRKNVLAFALIAAPLVLLNWLFPPPLEKFLAERAQGSTIVLDKNGVPLRAFADARGVWRYPISVQGTSPLYLQSLLNYEDRWFFRHPGVNPASMLRAVVQAIQYRRPISGGSTITMQIARMIEPIPHTAVGKIWQMLRALQLELRLSKSEILTLYLQHAPFGGPIEGVEAASFAYLGHSSKQLSDAQAALLVVLPQRPSALRPDRHAGRAQAARDKVLRRLQDFGVLSPARAAAALQESVVARGLRAPMQAALLAERLRSESMRAALKSGTQPPARIDSSIDSNWQAMAEARVTSYVRRFPERTSIAALIVDNQTMLVRAYVGSARFAEAASLGHIDMIRASRSPGSTLKPSLYGMAIDAGLIHSESLLIDAPQSFLGYRPANFSESFNGPISAASALRLSLNVPAVDLLQRFGPAKFHGMLANAGLAIQLPPGAVPNLSLILGGGGARLEQLVGLHSALVRGGLAATPRLTDSQPLQNRYLLSPGAAWIVYSMLAANPRPGASPLFADTAAKVAFKTGTSFGFRDAWALGATEKVSIGVWVGRPDGTPVPGSFGAASALPLLFELYDALPSSALGRAPGKPNSVTDADICWPLGTGFEPQQANLCHSKKQAWVLDNAIPPSFPDREARVWQPERISIFIDRKTGLRRNASCLMPEVDVLEIARWPALAYPWLSARIRKLASPPELAPGCAQDSFSLQALVIEGLSADALLRLPSNRTQTPVGVKVIGTAAPVRWLLNDVYLGDSEGSSELRFNLPAPGSYRLLAQDATGRYAVIDFRVQ